jgi:hypothetical protein
VLIVVETALEERAVDRRVDSADREKKAAWKAEERRRARAAFPLPDEELEDLFDFLDRQLGAQGCDDTRRFTEEWARDKDCPLEPLGAWLEDNGGYCDCEVLANVEPHWEENRLRPADG